MAKARILRASRRGAGNANGSVEGKRAHVSDRRHALQNSNTLLAPGQDVTLGTFASELVYRSMDCKDDDASFQAATQRLAMELGVDMRRMRVRARVRVAWAGQPPR